MTRSRHNAIFFALVFGLSAFSQAQAQQDLQTAPPVLADPQASEPLGGFIDATEQPSQRVAGAPLPFAMPKSIDEAPPQVSLPATPFPPPSLQTPSFAPAPSLLDLSPLRAELLESSEAQEEILPSMPEEIAADSMVQVMPSQADVAPSLVQPTIIQTQQLSSQDVASIGVLTQAQSGYSTQIWQRSGAADILQAWRGMPREAPSPAIQNTLATLALTVASAPSVSEARAWALLESRIDVLASIGRLGDAVALLSRAPSDLAPSHFLRRKADIALWAEDWPMACEAARIGLDRNPGAYWTNVSLACHAISGNRGAVDLLLDVLTPNEQPSRSFMTAIYALLDRTDLPSRAKPQRIDMDVVGPLLSALASALDESSERGPEFLDAPALAHASAAYGARAGLSGRWPGLAALAYRGRIQPENLLQYIVAAPPTTPGDRSLGVAPRDLQRPLTQSNPQRRVADLLALSSRANTSGLSQFWAPAVGYVLKDVEPQTSLWPDAGAIAAHLAFAGEGARVTQWYNHIRGRARSNDLQAAQSLMAVWPYAVLLDAQREVPYTDRIAQLWRQTLNAPSQDLAVQRTSYFYIALEALGYPITPDLWAESGASPAVEGALSENAALQAVVQRGETGRGILLSLATLGRTGTNAPDPVAFRAALETLVALGQEALARQVAAEVLFFSNISHSDGR